MFFVISDYLITTNILRARREQNFTYTRFYTSRIKRLIPAVTFLILVVLAVGSLVMLPSDLLDLAHSAVFASLSSANIYFYLFLDTSYFAPDSAEQPLLHLWSLGVEEQFYLVWPLLLVSLLAVRSALLRMGLLLLGVVASIVVGEFYSARSPDFAYYMLPARAYQLMAGACLAMALEERGRAQKGAWLAVLVGVIGLVFAFVWQQEHEGFPGVSSLPVTLATLALLYAGFRRSSPLGPILGNAAVQWVGNASYSIYLWHWPVVAFAKYAMIQIDLWVGLGLLGLVLAMSAVSYHGLETPLRRANLSFSQAALRLLVLPAVLFGLVAAGLTVSEGVAPWVDSEAIDQARDAPSQVEDRRVCLFPILKGSSLQAARCVVGAAAQGQDDQDEPNMLLWGDSNATHFVGMLDEFAQAGNFR